MTIDRDLELREALAAGSVAVLVIDMQRDFCDADGALARLGADVSRSHAVIGPLDAFVGRLRDRGASIIWVRQVARTEFVSDARRRRAAAMGRTPTAICAAGSSGTELADGLHPVPVDVMLEKSRYSAFVGTGLELMLRAQGIQTVVVCGTSANVCVDSTTRDAYLRDFDAVVAEDLLGWTDGALADAALRILAAYFATVAPADAIESAFASVAEQVTR